MLKPTNMYGEPLIHLSIKMLALTLKELFHGFC